MGIAPASATVGDLVLDRPSRSRVFSELGIDFCCGGKKTLERACAERGLDLGEVVARLEAEPAPVAAVDWRNEPLGALCNHLEATHHVYTKAELPRLREMLDKVARVHGERHPEMIEVAALFGRLADDLSAHLLKEERVLFPAMRGIDAGRVVDLTPPVRVMLAEHDDAGAILHELRTLTKGYVPPGDGCNTYRAALAGLEDFERDLHEHVHLENNVLFPRVTRHEQAAS
jgi:regulator of cell morphogenesis and NO signaling